MDTNHNYQETQKKCYFLKARYYVNLQTSIRTSNHIIPLFIRSRSRENPEYLSNLPCLLYRHVSCDIFIINMFFPYIFNHYLAILNSIFQFFFIKKFNYTQIYGWCRCIAANKQLVKYICRYYEYMGVYHDLSIRFLDSMLSNNYTMNINQL